MTKPNQVHAPEKSSDPGELVIAESNFSDGTTPVGIIVSPAKSTVSWQKKSYAD